MPQPDTPSPGKYGTNGQNSPEATASDLSDIIQSNSCGAAFDYVLSQPWRKPRDEDEPELKTKNLGFHTPKDLHALISKVLSQQNLTKTRTFVAYVRIHVALSEMFGTEGAAGVEAPFEEPDLGPDAPLRELYHYVTRTISAKVETKGPQIGVQVPVELVQDFKSWTAKQGATMSNVMLRYTLFHIGQHRKKDGFPPKTEE